MSEIDPTSSPSTHGSSGQDAKGRFAPGNRLGRGNPLAGRAAKIRAVLLKKLTTKQAGEIVDVLIGMAKAGDIAAIRELFDRTAGKPSSTELLERVEKLEQMAERANQNGEESHA